jgi:hypothetical protein
MSNITVVLDACSIINLIHIDSEDEFLIKKLNCLKVHICEYVYKEVQANAFTIPEEKERISQAISKFLPYRITNSNVVHDMNNKFYSDVKSLSGYRKKNGEFYSIALSLYLSQLIPTKLFFYTDDYVAKEDFSLFYDIHQIGGIKDTADLLLLLYRLDDKFSKKELIRLLSSLFSQYAMDTTILLSKLRKYSIPKTLRKDRRFNEYYRKLIYSLDHHHFEGINLIKDFFIRHRNGRYQGVVNLINQHKEVFNLESYSNNYLDKIKGLIRYLKTNEVYKFAC